VARSVAERFPIYRGTTTTCSTEKERKREREKERERERERERLLSTLRALRARVTVHVRGMCTRARILDKVNTCAARGGFRDCPEPDQPRPYSSYTRRTQKPHVSPPRRLNIEAISCPAFRARRVKGDAKAKRSEAKRSWLASWLALGWLAGWLWLALPRIPPLPPPRPPHPPHTHSLSLSLSLSLARTPS